jgi:hypothetical protein
MPSIYRRAFSLRPHHVQGVWESNDGRYRAYAHELLAQLESLCADVLVKWPAGVGASITDQSQYPELWKLARVRDRTSDTVRIYAAMAVEGFLNFYGVLRLGQDVFDEHFERLGVVSKLRSLLLVCDQLDISRQDPLVMCLDKLATSRNALVHPKTKEVDADPQKHQRSSTKVPEVARECVANMEAFFDHFVHALPNAKQYLARNPEA